MNYKESAIYSMAFRAQTDRAEALASLNLLLEHPAGIGDHSTGDLHNNLNESLSKLTDADDRLETLHKYFPEIRAALNNGNTPTT